MDLSKLLRNAAAGTAHHFSLNYLHGYERLLSLAAPDCAEAVSGLQFGFDLHCGSPFLT